MMPSDPERKLAAHVQATIVGQGLGGQAKLKVQEGGQVIAAHVHTAIATGQGLGGQAKMERERREMATHVQAAIAAGQPKMERAGGPAVAAHVQAAIAEPKVTAAMQPKGAAHGGANVGVHVWAPSDMSGLPERNAPGPITPIKTPPGGISGYNAIRPAAVPSAATAPAIQRMEQSEVGRTYTQPNEDQLKAANKTYADLAAYEKKFSRRSEYLEGRGTVQVTSALWHGVNKYETLQLIAGGRLEPKKPEWGALDASRDGVLSVSPSASSDYKYMVKIPQDVASGATWKRVGAKEYVTYSSFDGGQLKYFELKPNSEGKMKLHALHQL